MKTSKITLFIISISLFCQVAYAQQKRFINYTEIGLLIQSSTSQSGKSSFTGYRTRTGFTKLVTNHWGLGFTLGTDNYRKENGASYNTLPITISSSYYLNEEFSGLSIDVYSGYAVKLFNNLNKGLTAGGGLSYSFPINKGFNLGFQTGYNFQKIDFPANYSLGESFSLGNIRLGVGITFK
jgi:hypothetical protein